MPDTIVVTDEQNNKLIAVTTKEEINLAIKRLKTGNMAGADGFGPEWSKIMEAHLASTLLKTFNWVMEKKMIPAS